MRPPSTPTGSPGHPPATDETAAYRAYLAGFRDALLGLKELLDDQIALPGASPEDLAADYTDDYDDDLPLMEAS